MSRHLSTAAMALLATMVIWPMGLIAQESAGPEGVPPEISAMLGQAANGGGEVAIAPSEEPSGIDTGMPGLAGSRYLYTTLRVITNGSPRGCSYANWTCMTNLCKSDLQDTSAWRGWAGCWRKDNNYICYFECGQRREAF